MFDLPPDVPPPTNTSMLVAEAPNAKATTRTDTLTASRTIGVCHLAANPVNRVFTAVNTLNPAVAVWDYLERTEKQKIDEADYLKAKVTVLQGPGHGTFANEGTTYTYQPDANFFGNDRATFLVEIGRWKIKAHHYFNVLKEVPGGTEGFDPYDDKRFCPYGRDWKISLNHINHGHDLTVNKFAITSPWSRRGETAHRFL